MAIRSTVVDEVPYASPDDVLKHIRNRDSFTDPGQSEAISMLMDRSDFVDDRTNKAWRRREVTDWDKSIDPSHLQKHQRHRRRTRYRSGRRVRDPTKLADPWVPVQLPHLNIVSVEKLELILGVNYTDETSNGTETVTADLDDESWYLQPSRGRIQVDLSNLTVGGVSVWGRAVIRTGKARVSYQHGNDESATATEAASGNVSGTTDPASSSSGVSTAVPDTLRDAVGKLVAADIARMDDLGEMFRQSTSGDLDLTGAANDLKADAMDSINEHRRSI